MKLHYIICATAALLAALSSCKTTEANYRAAYQTAVEQRRQASGLDGDTYGKVQRTPAAAQWLAVGADSLPVRKEYVGYPKDQGASHDNMKRYNVVTGQFRQIFNAKQMRSRLLDAGYDGAKIVSTREPVYYVIAADAAEPAQALEAWRRVTSDPSMVLKAPLPFVLVPANFR